MSHMNQPVQNPKQPTGRFLTEQDVRNNELNLINRSKRAREAEDRKKEDSKFYKGLQDMSADSFGGGRKTHNKRHNKRKTRSKKNRRSRKH